MREQRQLPIAVYGTLREGEHNAFLWQDLGGVSTRCDILGFRLVMEADGWFPFAVPSIGDVSVGDLVSFPVGDVAYEVALARMDRLEGVPNFYRRVITTVTVDGVPTEAWIYTPAQPEKYVGLNQVRENDWCLT